MLRTGNAYSAINALVQEIDAGSIYFDFSPLIGPHKLAKKVASENHSKHIVVVDTHNIVPVWVTSNKQEFAAHTIRRKLHKVLEGYVKEPGTMKKQVHSLKAMPQSVPFADAEKYIDDIASNGIKLAMNAGECAAHDQLALFINEGLESYADERNNIAIDGQSRLSPYLHFGHISSLRVALDVLKATDSEPLLFREARMAQSAEIPSNVDGMNAIYEEMIVRKELSDNYCFYNAEYRSIDGAADWAKKTLSEHKDDKREFEYSLKQWEDADTHDDTWNAAQKQMMITGKMHGYMRMYWAKKILEWSKTPEEAIKTAIYLNDHYTIDGNDPNGYVGILWSIAGLHDRAWTERNVFGKIRYMNAKGIARKFDVASYISQWNT